MADLPILQNSGRIVEAARKHRRLIISSPPGSGKSTQVPQLLLDNGLAKGKIAVLEPRRLAARMLARRVAQERKSAVGAEVGYRVRFEDKTGKNTRIIFETEGILLRELVSDRELSAYSAIILDEFHERHLHCDLALACCLALQRGKRPDLLVVAMSATLDEKALQSYMAPCELITAHGRVHPVSISYCDAQTAKLPPWEAAAKICGAALPQLPGGHALVFMPGAYEINRTAAALEKNHALSDFSVCMLYGELPPERQDAALAASKKRKIIVATNIAETSLTIDGVTAVVDSGLAKIARYDGARAINTLFTEKTALSSCEQRAGRAGRTAPGICVRLWTEREQRERPLSLEPEMLRLD
ncbi:MAG TPA: helicase-related protein, partial [Elusimicrobiales bacterium]|nr:helicase-related protein [Elusimicrobiales bacterium]